MIRRILAGMGLSTGIILVTMVGQVVAVPMYLTHWGTQIYGEWLILTNLIANLSFLNLGVQSYVSNRLIAHYVRGELDEGTHLLHAALRLYVVLCSLALAVTLALVACPGIPAWLQIIETPAIHARLILGIQGLLATYAILGGLLMSLFRVTQQLPRQLRYALIERIVFLAVPMAVAVLGGYPLRASLVSGLVIAGVVCVEIWDVNRRSPYPIGLSGSSWRAPMALLGPSLVFFAVSVATPLLSTGMTVVISTVIGAVAVAVFNTTLMLSNMIRLMINQGLNVLWPEITAAAAVAGAPGRLARWHRLIIKLVGGLVLIASAGLSLFGADVLAVWTRGKIQVDPWLNLLLVVYLVIQTPALVSRVFGLATNHQGEVFRVEVTTAIISISLAVWMLPRLGVRGVALALIIGQAIGTVWVMKLACRWTSDAWTSLLKEGVVRGLPTVLIMVLMSLGIRYLRPGVIGQALGFAGAGIIATYLAWRTWFTNSERSLVVTRLLNTFVRRFQ
jgi:O-antigen/teichoic acid export membrane protein